MLEEGMKSLNEIKALVETYHGFFFFYISRKKQLVLWESGRIHDKERRK